MGHAIQFPRAADAWLGFDGCGPFGPGRLTQKIGTRRVPSAQRQIGHEQNTGAPVA
jgi:hypothetical protein